MKKMVQVEISRKERVEKEFEFPLYRQMDVGDEYTSTYYQRVEADGTRFTIHETSYRGSEFEISVEGPGFPSDFGFEDNGWYACDESEFAGMLNRVMAFVRRFPDNSEESELSRLRAENAKLRGELTTKVGELESRLRLAAKENERLVMIHDAVRRDVESFGVGYTVHIKGKGMDRLPPEVVMLKGNGGGSSGNFDTVGGLEMTAKHRDRSKYLDTSNDLDRCRHCGSPAGYRQEASGIGGGGQIRVECSNTSCAIATPFHYRTREDAAYAWNRKPGDPPARGA